jgi:hypothetical protein
MIQGHSVKIATIDLSMPWKEIRERLLKILAPLQPEAE